MSGNGFWRKIKRSVLWRSIDKFFDDNGFEHAGYCAFLNLFAIMPIFIVLMAAMSSAYETGPGVAIIKSVIDLLPNYALSFVKPQIDEIFVKPSMNMISVAFLGAIWTTSSTIEGMRTIFNKVYRVKNPSFFLITRMMSIVQFILLVVTSVSVIAVITILPKILNKLEVLLKVSLPHVDYSPAFSSFVVFIILIYLVSFAYYSLTNSKYLSMVEVLPGAIITVVLWYFGTEVMTYYLLQNISSFNVIYGGLTSVIVALIFFYIVNIVLIYGAVFNYVLRKQHPHIYEDDHIFMKMLSFILFQSNRRNK